MSAAVVDVRTWQRQVARAGDLPRSVKAVANAVAACLDAHGRGAAPLADLMAISTYRKRAVLYALRRLRAEGWLHVLVPHRRAPSLEGQPQGRATVYQATTPALLARVEVHGGARQRGVEVHGGAPDRGVEVHGRAPQAGVEVHGGAPLLEERKEKERTPPTSPRPLMTAVAAVDNVDSRDVDHVLGHLPTHLRPSSTRELGRFDLFIRQRLAAGHSRRQLVDAGSTCTALPRGEAVGLWAHHVDRELAMAARRSVIALPETRPTRPRWCGECDAATRCVLDEYGLPDTRQKCSTCHPHGFGVFMAAGS